MSMKKRLYEPLATTRRNKKRIEQECMWCWYGMGFVLAVLLGALVYFHLTVVMPFLDVLVPEAQAMTNEEACALLAEGHYKGADIRAEAYCDELNKN